MSGHEWEARFIEHLKGVAAREDRAGLAALRKGLMTSPGGDLATYPMVLPWVPEAAGRAAEEAAFLVGALFALHPLSAEKGNLGDSFRSLGEKAAERQGGAERRFMALLQADEEDLGQHLHSAVTLLRSKEVPVNYHQLLRDVQNWDSESKWVQKAWAKAYWGNRESEQ